MFSSRRDPALAYEPARLRYTDFRCRTGAIDIGLDRCHAVKHGVNLVGRWSRKNALTLCRQLNKGALEQRSRRPLSGYPIQSLNHYFRQSVFSTVIEGWQIRHFDRLLRTQIEKYRSVAFKKFFRKEKLIQYTSQGPNIGFFTVARGSRK